MIANEKAIVFAGAGFSKAFGFPDTNELWSIALTNFSDDGATESIEKIRHSYPLSYFIEKHITDFELLLSVWTAHIQNYYDHIPDANWIKGGELEDFLINLCRKLENMENNLKNSDQFKKISGLLRKSIQKRLLIFWTTNYDRVIEHLIKEAGAEYNYLDTPGNLVKLRKLHGSINWLTYPSKVERKFDKWEPPTLHTTINNDMIMDFRNEQIPFISAKGCPAIIPPIISKKYDEIFVKTIQQVSLDTDCGKNMIIVGYSFRESDIRINIILGETMTKILSKGGKVFIVNPDKSHEKEIVAGFGKIINENIIHIQDKLSENVLKNIFS